jgi:DNA modification methylase
MNKAQVLLGDVRQRLAEIPDDSIQACITSPPYWGLRDYGQDDQIGLEQDPNAFVASLVDVFREVKRALTPDGVFWLNIGDSYSGSGKGTAGNLGKKHNERHLEHKHSAIIPDGLKPKDLVGIPWRLAFALQADGWYLRQDIIWHKPNVMPESVKDRCTKAHEYLFMLTKSQRYYFDNEAIFEPVAEVSLARAKRGLKTDRPSAKTSSGGIDVEEMGERFVNPKGRNRRSVWSIPPARFKGAHFAVMPEGLVEPCVLSSTKPGDTVLDPFMGSATVGVVALRHNRSFLGCELNPDYVAIAQKRIADSNTDLFNQTMLDII